MRRPPVLIATLWTVLLLFVTTASAQSRAPGPDPIMLEVSKAVNEGRLMDAEQILTAAIQKLESDDSTNPRLAIYLRRLAIFYQQKHQFAEALALLQRALENDQHSFGYSDARVANDLSSIAGVHLAQGEKREAETFFKEGLKIALQNPTQDSYSAEVEVGALSNLSSFYISEKRYSEAEILLQQAAQLCGALTELQGSTSGCSSISDSSDLIHRSEGKPVDTVRAQHSGNELYDEIVLINRRGQDFEEQGNLQDAKAEFLRALARIETSVKKSGDSHSLSFLSEEFNLLGQVFDKEKEDHQAEEFYIRAIRTQESLADSKPPGSFQIHSFNFSYLLNFYRERDRLQDIEPLIEQAIQVQEKFLGTDDAAIADTALQLAAAYEQQGVRLAKKAEVDAATLNYVKAKSVCERALQIQQRNFGPDHPKSVPALTVYMGVLRELRDLEAADRVEAHISAILGKNRERDRPQEMNSPKP